MADIADKHAEVQVKIGGRAAEINATVESFRGPKGDAFTWNDLTDAQIETLIAQAGETVERKKAEALEAIQTTAAREIGRIPDLSGLEAEIEQMRRAAMRNESVTPESYGAVGDGATDDSAAFARAISTGKRVVGDSAKEYRITSVELSGTNVYLEGCRFYIPPQMRMTKAINTRNCPRIYIRNCVFRTECTMEPAGYDSDEANSRYIDKGFLVSNVDFIRLYLGVEYALIEGCEFINGVFCVNPRNSAYEALNGQIVIRNNRFLNMAIAAEIQYMKRCIFDGNECIQGEYAGKLSHILYLSNSLPGMHGIVRGCEMSGVSNNIIQCYHSSEYLLEVENCIIRGKTPRAVPDVLSMMTNASKGSRSFFTGCIIDCPDFTLTGRPNEGERMAEFTFTGCTINIGCGTHTSGYDRAGIYRFNNCGMTINQRGFYGDNITLTGCGVTFNGVEYRMVSAQNFRASGCRFISYSPESNDALLAFYGDCSVSGCFFESLADTPKKLFIGYNLDNYVDHCIFKGFREFTSYPHVTLGGCAYIDNYHLCAVNAISDGHGAISLAKDNGDIIVSGSSVRNKTKIVMAGDSLADYTFSRWSYAGKSSRRNPNTFSIREDTDVRLYHKYETEERVSDVGIVSWTNGRQSARPTVTLHSAGTYRLLGRNIARHASAVRTRYSPALTNEAGTTILSTTEVGDAIRVTQTEAPDSFPHSAYNGAVHLYFWRYPDFSDKVYVSMHIQVLDNPLGSGVWRIYTTDADGIDHAHIAEEMEDGRFMVEIDPDEMGFDDNTPFVSLRLAGRSVILSEIQCEFADVTAYEAPFSGGVYTLEADGAAQTRTLLQKDGFNQIIQMDGTDGLIEVEIGGTGGAQTQWDENGVGKVVWENGSEGRALTVYADAAGTYHHTGKNLVKNLSTNSTGITAAKSTYGTSLNTTGVTDSIVVTQENYAEPDASSYKNGQFYIIMGSVPVDGMVTISFDVEVTANPLGYANKLMFYGNKTHTANIVNGRVEITIPGSSMKDLLSYTYRKGIPVRNNGRSLIIRNLQVEPGEAATAYETPRTAEVAVLDAAGTITDFTQHNGYNAIVQTEGEAAMISVRHGG